MIRQKIKFGILIFALFFSFFSIVNKVDAANCLFAGYCSESTTLCGAGGTYGCSTACINQSYETCCYGFNNNGPICGSCLMGEDCAPSTGPGGQNPGCTNPNASNYDSSANVDDGSCVIPPPPSPQCGDGVVNAGEQCDSGSYNGSCLAGAACSSGCTNNNCGSPSPAPSSCRCVIGGECVNDNRCAPPPESCGDRRVGVGEQCDLGSANNGACPSDCSATCQINVCGSCSLPTSPYFSASAQDKITYAAYLTPGCYNTAAPVDSRCVINGGTQWNKGGNESDTSQPYGTAVCNQDNLCPGCFLGYTDHNDSLTISDNPMTCDSRYDCSALGPMSGTLTPASGSCIIALGASTCNINFTWNTVNPRATSAVTKPVNITVGTGNSGSATFAIKFNFENFYLYNNGELLAQKLVTSSCTAGTSWNGTVCATTVANTQPNPPVISGPTTGAPNALYTYSFIATDPDNNQVRYGIDWDGNGVINEWTPLVNSGTSASLNYAWTTNGTYTFRALTEDSNASRSGFASYTVTISTPACSGNCAQYITQTVPSTVVAGAAFSATVTMKNVGTNTWISSGTNLYRLDSKVSGNQWGGPYNVTSDIVPNSQQVFTINVTAPSTPGAYDFQWQMDQKNISGSWFGDITPNKVITVLPPAPAAPTGLTATCNATGDQVTLSWNPSTYATSYTLRITPGPTVTQTGTTYLADITPNQNYTWTVYGSNSTGNGALSAGAFKCPDTFLLTVNATPGTGGNIKSLDNIINCGVTCSAAYVKNSNVTLRAVPNSSYWKFNGWGGDCLAFGTNPLCSLNINANKSASATFIPRLFDYKEF